MLSEHVEEARATSDAEIMAAVSNLVEALAKDEAAGNPNVHILATVTGGVAGVVGAQNISIGSMVSPGGNVVIGGVASGVEPVDPWPQPGTIRK